jgi:glutathione synthase
VLALPGVLERFVSDGTAAAAAAAAAEDAAAVGQGAVSSPPQRSEEGGGSVLKDMRDCFAGLHSLDADAPGREAFVAEVVADPQRWVMKPQREGGGNNLYGADVAAALSSMPLEEQQGYILMERLFPPLNPSWCMRGGQLQELRESISELGVYGFFVGKLGAGAPLLNENGGSYLLRTKASTDNEGGVMAGASALDAVYLT